MKGGGFFVVGGVGEHVVLWVVWGRVLGGVIC